MKLNRLHQTLIGLLILQLTLFLAVSSAFGGVNAETRTSNHAAEFGAAHQDQEEEDQEETDAEDSAVEADGPAEDGMDDAGFPDDMEMEEEFDEFAMGGFGGMPSKETMVAAKRFMLEQEFKNYVADLEKVCELDKKQMGKLKSEPRNRQEDHERMVRKSLKKNFKA